jgi:anti-sigma regulatory factor (Ser/Thr protein kinase)
VSGDGTATWLDGGASQPFSGSHSFESVEATAVLDPGALLVLYTDGLVERRGEHIEKGLARLDSAVRSLHGRPVGQICASLSTELRPETGQADDVVILVVRMGAHGASVFEWTLPARPEELRALRAAAREWLDRQGLDTGDREAVVLALGEACANAVEHAYADAPSGDVKVEISTVDGALVVEVRDTGAWRAESHDDPDRGRGFQLMRALSESVDVEPGEAGTTVRISFPTRRR